MSFISLSVSEYTLSCVNTAATLPAQLYSSVLVYSVFLGSMLPRVLSARAAAVHMLEPFG